MFLFASKKVTFKLANMKEVFIFGVSMFAVAIIMNVILVNFDPNVDFFYMMKGFGLGLHPALNAFILLLVGTAIIFAIYGICRLCYYLSAKYRARKTASPTT